MFGIDFSEMPMEQQIAFGMLLPFIPVIIGETLFFYLILFAKMNILMSFSISLSFTVFGLLLWYMWRDQVRREIMEYEPINANLRWTKEIVTWENQMIVNRISLKNEHTLRPVDIDVKDNVSYPQFDNPPVFEKEVLYYSRKSGTYIRKKLPLAFKPASIKVGLHNLTVANKEVVENILTGKKCTEVHLHHNSFSPSGIPYKKVQFIHYFPYQEDFFLCPDQFVVHQAQVMGGASSVVDAVFLYWGERGEPIPVFLVLSSPALAELVQVSIGMKPALALADGTDNEDATKAYGTQLRHEIQDAVNLGDAVQSVILQRLLKARTNTLQAMADGQKDVEDLALGLWGDWVANERDIEDIKPLIDLSNWKHVALLIAGAMVVSGMIYLVFIK